MATQKEVLRLVKKQGFYTAKLYHFVRSSRGHQEVNPAKKLEEKGLLELKSEKTEGATVTYTWVKAAKKHHETS